MIQAPAAAVPTLLFGLAVDRCLYTLTLLVTRIRKGRASLVSVEDEAVASDSDWITRTIRITYVEARGDRAAGQ